MELQRVRRPEGPQDWEAQRAVITDLYVTKGLELEDLMKIMEDEHFFKATKKQYKTHFTKWDLRKNVRPSEYSAMIRKRKEREEEGKDSAFRLRGALVDDSKIVRYEKKTKTGDEREIAEAGTPGDLSCFTPSPIASSPNAPSPDLRHFQSPNLLTNSIVSPSEQTHIVLSFRIFSPESLDLKVLLDCFLLAKAVLSPSQDLRSVTLAIGFENSRSGDMFKNLTVQSLGDFGSGTLNVSMGLNGSKPSFFTPLSGLTEYAQMQRVVGSRIWQSVFLHFLVSLEPYGSFSKVSISQRRRTDSVVDGGEVLWGHNATPGSYSLWYCGLFEMGKRGC